MEFLLIYVPNLRFREFHTEWEKIQIGNLIKERKEYTSDFEKYPLYSFTIESGITPKSDRYERSFLVKKEGDLFKIVHQNDFVMNPMNLRFGALNYSKINQTVSVSGYYDIFTIDACKYNEFWNAYLKTPRMLYTYNTIATGSLVEKKRVYFKQLKELKMCIPSEMEKNKINEFINLLNERIQTQNKIIDDYMTYRNAIVDYFFESLSSDWNRIKLSNILKEYSELHVKDNSIVHATLSKEGIFPKTDRYDRDFLVKDEDKKYKVTHLNDICYNPANLKFGVITRNTIGDCIISPIYVTFKIENGFLPKFVELLVTRKRFISRARKYEQGTVYERMAVNSSDLLSMYVSIPSLNTQQTIVNIINNIDNKISNEKELLKLYRAQKVYLLKNMFI